MFPPGFRFHPTDEELVVYYLKRKICRRTLKLDIIGETDVYKFDPHELPGLSKLKSGDRQWFFFSPRDRKYPNGARSNRATLHGYWKTTGKDRKITCNSRSVGVKKTLVYYDGRAPSGLRTDWVMHEYTLDEEELRRCQSAQDYYALYKVYKKSGPGPKNGEQYGAPFKEEEWAEDESSDVNGFVDMEKSVMEFNNVISDDNTKVNSQFPLNDFEELMSNILPIDNTKDNTKVNSQILLKDLEVLMNDIEDDPLLVSDRAYNEQSNFEIPQPIQIYESCEIISAPIIPSQEPRVVEDFLEDFLEINDLVGPEPTVQSQNFEKPVENLLFDDMDGLSELDLFHDAAMFLREISPGEPEHFSQSYLNIMENETVNYQMGSYSNDPNQISCQLWEHDETCSVFTPIEANQGIIPPPTSGLVYEYDSANQLQNENGIEDDRNTSSWLSSALWGFVESIPTTPASASEGAILGRAFERLSSFGRVRVNTRRTNYSTSTRSDRSNSRAVFYFSFLVVVCAVLWMLLGTSSRLLSRYVSL